TDTDAAMQRTMGGTLATVEPGFLTWLHARFDPIIAARTAPDDVVRRGDRGRIHEAAVQRRQRYDGVARDKLREIELGVPAPVRPCQLLFVDRDALGQPARYAVGR